MRAERFELMAGLEKLPSDTVFFTQITMEAAEDTEFLDAMKRARILGALVGVESVSEAGLKDVYKGFNLAGDALIERLNAEMPDRLQEEPAPATRAASSCRRSKRVRSQPASSTRRASIGRLLSRTWPGRSPRNTWSTLSAGTRTDCRKLPVSEPGCS